MNSNNKPLISVITICRNESPHIKKTIQSVKQQTFLDYEHVVIDGGSEDGTVEIIESLSYDKMCWISEPDRGIYHAMNKGLAMARGSYLLFLNGGDALYSENVFREIFSFLTTNKLIAGKICFEFDDKLSLIEDAPLAMSSAFLIESSLFHPATFIHKSLFEKLGPYDESFKIAGDYEFFLRCLKAGAPYGKVENVIALFRRDGVSSIPQFFQIIAQERRRAYIKNFGYLQWVFEKIRLKIRLSYSSK